MPRFTPYTTGQLRRARERLAEASYAPVADLTVHAWRTAEPVPFGGRQSGQALQLRPGDAWGDLFDCAWFHFTGTVPEAVRDDDVVLLLDVHGELCVVDAAGAPVCGLTTVTSTFDLNLGQPGKRVLPWYPDDDEGSVDVWADAGCNDLFGHLQGNGTLREARIAVCHEEVRALYYDVEVLLDFLDVLPAESPRHHQVRRALGEVARLLDAPAALEHGLAAVAAEGRALLAPHLARRGGDPALRISAVGHAHMDLAWLWPIRETIRKGARTFSTALELFERYPDYTDQCEHVVTYSFLPHTGDVVAGGVARAGYELNVPLRSVRFDAARTPAPAVLLPARRSWFAVETSPTPSAAAPGSAPAETPPGAAPACAVVVESVKAAEDGSGDTIVRLYERHGAAALAALIVADDIDAAHLADLLETRQEVLAVVGGRVELAFGPFEIHTVRLRRA